jgi:outer membrane protein assembly factor BamA
MRLSGFFILLLLAAVAPAQLSVQGPSSIYEGQNVGAIDLIGNPHRDMEPLRHLVAQEVGQPYSQAHVEASISALEKTGQFPKVQVNVVPDPSGLRLNFLLEPAYYLGIINFPELSKLFPYTRLLQVVNLPDEDPFDKARVAIAQGELRKFLLNNGYFQPEITVHTDINDDQRLVSLTFSVNPGKRARIGEVVLRGSDPSENTRLLHSLRSLRARFTGGLLKAGRPYTPERMAAATNLIRRVLSKDSRLASHIQQNPPQYHPDTNRVDVSFNVDLGPVERFAFQARACRVCHLFRDGR